eukprot:GHVL01028586.1.p1 GENE.GHVL01028586.1~~GHVL01028586.1.p1  ORF type:complete len:998 (-),score=234.23 GHVL01028586.1:170-3163(-)
MIFQRRFFCSKNEDLIFGKIKSLTKIECLKTRVSRLYELTQLSNTYKVPIRHNEWVLKEIADILAQRLSLPSSSLYELSVSISSLGNLEESRTEGKIVEDLFYRMIPVMSDFCPKQMNLILRIAAHHPNLQKNHIFWEKVLDKLDERLPFYDESITISIIRNVNLSGCSVSDSVNRFLTNLQKNNILEQLQISSLISFFFEICQISRGDKISSKYMKYISNIFFLKILFLTNENVFDLLQMLAVQKDYAINNKNIKNFISHTNFKKLVYELVKRLTVLVGSNGLSVRMMWKPLLASVRLDSCSAKLESSVKFALSQKSSLLLLPPRVLLPLLQITEKLEISDSLVGSNLLDSFSMHRHCLSSDELLICFKTFRQFPIQQNKKRLLLSGFYQFALDVQKNADLLTSELNVTADEYLTASKYVTANGLYEAVECFSHFRFEDTKPLFMMIRSVNFSDSSSYIFSANHFSCENIIQIIHIFANLQVIDKSIFLLLTKLQKKIKNTIGNLDECAILIYSLGKLQIDHSIVSYAVNKIKRQNNLNGNYCAMTLWGLCSLNKHDIIPYFLFDNCCNDIDNISIKNKILLQKTVSDIIAVSPITGNIFLNKLQSTMIENDNPIASFTGLNRIENSYNIVNEFMNTIYNDSKLLTETEYSNKLLTETENSNKLLTEAENSNDLLTETENSNELLTETKNSNEVLTETDNKIKDISLSPLISLVDHLKLVDLNERKKEYSVPASVHGLGSVIGLLKLAELSGDVQHPLGTLAGEETRPQGGFECCWSPSIDVTYEVPWFHAGLKIAIDVLPEKAFLTIPEDDSPYLNPYTMEESDKCETATWQLHNDESETATWQLRGDQILRFKNIRDSRGWKIVVLRLSIVKSIMRDPERLSDLIQKANQIELDPILATPYPMATTGEGLNPMATTGEGLNPMATTGEGLNPMATTGEGLNPMATTGGGLNPAHFTPEQSNWRNSYWKLLSQYLYTIFPTNDSFIKNITQLNLK